MDWRNYAIVAAVLGAGILGLAAERSEPTRRTWNVELHARTAHCQLAAKNRPLSVQLVCA